jgi:hypothetical protein
MKKIRLFENDENVNWGSIVENIFYDNYVPNNPDKFLTALENELKRLNYPSPTKPLGFDNFGGPKGEKQIVNNLMAIQLRSFDRQRRTIDRIIVDTLVNKFFKGDEKVAGEAYQNWILKTRKLETKKESNGSDFKIFTSINDIPIWTPNEDVVDYMGNKFYLNRLFGGKYYENYEHRDKKEKEDLEYRENREKKMYRDVCPSCQNSGYMKWVSSEDDYPEGMTTKAEFCSKCNPSGKPFPPYNYEEGAGHTMCNICKSYMSTENDVKPIKEIESLTKEIEHLKKRIEYYKQQIKDINDGKLDDNVEQYYRMTEADENKIKENEEQIQKLKDNSLTFNGKCKCSFDKLDAVVKRYEEFEDYESIIKMKKNPIYKSFFEQYDNNQNLQEQIKRIKGIMYL